MAHEVTLDISTKFVLHKDVRIEVKKDGKKLGTALVSKGNIENGFHLATPSIRKGFPDQSLLS